MPIVKLPVPEFLPDQGEIENPGLYKASGAIYYAGRWNGSPYVFPGNDVALGVTLQIQNLRGFHIHSTEDSNLSAQSIYFYVASINEIYRSTAANSRALTSATSALADIQATDGSGVQFISFGNSVIATAFGIAPTNSDILRALTPTSDFVPLVEYASPMTSYRPMARYITGIKNQILIGHVKFGNTAMPTGSALTVDTVYPSLVMWSAVDDPTRFGDPATTQHPSYDGSDYQLLADEYGSITGLVGGDSAYIFKERAIYKMEGPPYTFRPIVTGIGTLYANSIVRYYDDIYFWGPAGPTVLRSGSSTPEVLGVGKVSRTINDYTASNVIDAHIWDSLPERPAIRVQRAIDISGVADYKTGLIMWTASSVDNQLQTWTCPGKCVVYSTVDNAFSYFYLGSPGFFPKTIPQYHYQELFASASAPGYFLNDTFFIGGIDTDPDPAQDAYLRGFGFSDTVASEPENDADTYTYNDAVFEFGYLPMPPSQAGSDEVALSRITRIRPIYRSHVLTLGENGYDDETEEMSSFEAAQLKFTVQIYSTSSFPSRPHTITRTYDPLSDTWQNQDGWLDIETISASHHKIKITFQDPGTGNLSTRELGLLKDFIRLEVEYVRGGLGSGVSTI